MQDERWNNDVAADNLCFRWVKEIRREVFVSCNLELVIFLNCWTFSMPDDASQLSRKLIIVSYYLYLSLKVGALTENTSSNKVSKLVRCSLWVLKYPKKCLEDLTTFFMSTWWGDSKNMEEIEFSWWLFEGRLRQGKNVLPDGLNWLCYFAGSSKSHREDSFFFSYFWNPLIK